MTNAEKDFWIQFAASILRKLLLVAGAWLVQKGWISVEQSEGFSSLETAVLIAGAVCVLGTTLWSYAKVRYNINVVRDARDADSNKSISEIKTETLKKETIISAV